MLPKSLGAGARPSDPRGSNLTHSGNPLTMQISKNTFVEIQPAAPGAPASYNHFGIHVENVASAVEMFKARGAKVTPASNTSPTKALLSNITDLNGLRIELAELPPASLHFQAMDRWK